MQTTIEPPFTKTNWVIRPKTRDCVEILDGMNRSILLVKRIGRFGENGGSEPREIGEFILGLVGRGERADAPKVDELSDDEEVVSLRKRCDARGIKWHHRHKAARLMQLLDNVDKRPEEKPATKLDTVGRFKPGGQIENAANQRVLGVER